MSSEIVESRAQTIARCRDFPGSANSNVGSLLLFIVITRGKRFPALALSTPQPTPRPGPQLDKRLTDSDYSNISLGGGLLPTA